jgi:hypothetical protein
MDRQPHLRLVPPTQDRDTVEALTLLLAQAKEGKIIGLAYIALHHQHGYSADLVGDALKSPLLSRGICRALEDTIAAKKT